MSVHQNNFKQELSPDYNTRDYDTDHTSSVRIDSLSEETVRGLKGYLGYCGFMELPIGRVDARLSRGIIARDPNNETLRAIFVANHSQLFRYTISGNAQYGYSASFTDSTKGPTDAYDIRGAELATFSYEREKIRTHPNQPELEAYLVALEKCGYEALQIRENNPTRRGWLSGVISLLK